MQTLLPRGGWGHHSIPAAPHPPLARGFSQFSAAFTLCFPHPQPLSRVSLLTVVPGRRDVRRVGLNSAGKPAQERGCPAALLPLPWCWGILGSVVPAGAAVIQRLSLGLVEAHVHSSPPTCSFPWLAAASLPHLLLPGQQSYFSLLHLFLLGGCRFAPLPVQERPFAPILPKFSVDTTKTCS